MAQSDVDKIREDLKKTRERFAESVEGLVAEHDPVVLKDNLVKNVKGFIRGEVDHLKSFVRNPDGSWKIDVLVRAAIVGVGFVGSVLVLRKIFHTPKK